LYKRALATRERTLGLDHPAVAEVLDHLAAFYSDLGRYSDAEPLTKRALAIQEKAIGAGNHELALSLNNLAVIYHKQGRAAAAEPLFHRALQLLERTLGSDHPELTSPLGNLGALYADEGGYDEAERMHQRALGILERAFGPDHPRVGATLNNLARLCGERGRYEEAKLLMDRSLAIVKKALGDDHPEVALSLSNLATYHDALGQFEQAYAAASRAVAIIEKHLRLGTPDRSGGRLAQQRKYRTSFENYVGIAETATKVPSQRDSILIGTFRVVQLAQASAAALALAGMGARFSAGSEVLANLVRQRGYLVDRWQRLDADMVEASGRMPRDRHADQEATMRNDLAQTISELDEIDARMAAEFPEYAELSNPRPVAVSVAQGLLRADEALLIYLVGNQNTWLWILSGEGLGFTRCELSAEALTAEVAALRKQLDPELNPELEAFPAGRAHGLYQKLFARVEPHLAAAKHLIIVPDGALHGLPFGVLVTQRPERDPVTPGDHRSISWLAREYAITILPSVSSLWSLRQYVGVSKAVDPFCGIGNPILHGSASPAQEVRLASLFRGNLADVERVRELSPLPDTADELREIARILGATESDLLLGELACEPMLRRTALDRYRIIAFATHGLVTGELEGLAEPALVLTPPDKATPQNDGLLTASKIASLNLDADWVVLSACNTAAGDGTPDAGGLSGLAKAFFYAGARSLLVSHWAVWSKAAVKLTTETFLALTEDPSTARAEALKRSMAAMLDPSRPSDFAHPQAWAPFVLVGEGGAIDGRGSQVPLLQAGDDDHSRVLPPPRIPVECRLSGSETNVKLVDGPTGIALVRLDNGQQIHGLRQEDLAKVPRNFDSYTYVNLTTRAGETCSCILGGDKTEVFGSERAVWWALARGYVIATTAKVNSTRMTELALSHARAAAGALWDAATERDPIEQLRDQPVKRRKAHFAVAREMSAALTTEATKLGAEIASAMILATQSEDQLLEGFAYQQFKRFLWQEGQEPREFRKDNYQSSLGYAG
jgi:CHAT domain-containing protein